MFIHRWARKRRFNIYERIRSGKQLTEADLTSLIEELGRPQPTGQKVTKLAVSPDTRNKRLSTAMGYLLWFIDELIADPSTPEQLQERLTAMREKRVKVFLNGYQSAEGSRKFHKHLTGKQAQFLQDALDPEGEILFGRVNSFSHF
ncbi:hypothetical protein GIR22_18070 [Pseudomonas sp. CCM 7891]|uniref:Uncharacterized protein n=1 Tax=Pseudomonas karstica TaxID=1055468 RepID=A0A7X2RTX9_9PSED|nr:hypothetical protein [Pseudomonas karstica]MTD21032.1 hypothetical protein [Pseudomonas karstica]